MISNSRPTFPMPICESIWDMKYRFKRPDGTPIDMTIQDTWRRVANALAEAEEPSERAEWAQKFFEAMEGFKFIPAGRILAGAGTGRNVTLSNCLSGETLILTAEYGLVAIGEIVGETVHVLDGNGDWVAAPINSFGEQPVVPVTLRGGYNGRLRKTICATANHRWILADGTERTTEHLVAGNVLKFARRRNVPDTPDYRAGVRHGIIYGDGSQRPEGEVKLRLCGAKAVLIDFFSDWTITRPESYGGDPCVYGGRREQRGFDLKSLPRDGVGVDYLTGFLRGWMATDGCVSRGKALLSCGAEEADWLKRHGPVAGMEVSLVTKLGNSTNYGQRNKTIFNVHFHRWTMIPEDFLLEAHRAEFRPVEYPWIVESVGEPGEAVPVYCPRVVTTDSVQLDLGIHTGQCFTMGTIPDSMDGIFSHLREAALTMQQGGGIGYDFSTLRPKGALVKGVAADASGPLSFMDVWDAMCRTVMSAGSRRGAMMATMRCDHPDIEAFIEAKADPKRLRMFNVSVLVTDAFMEAVREDKPWRLHFEDEHGETVIEKIVSARALWDKIMRSTYDYAEPGVIFIDRVNEAHNLRYIERIATTNPCGEKPMGPYASCLLGSINVTAFVRAPFSDRCTFDYLGMNEVVRTAIRMMDNVVDVGGFPLPSQLEKAKQDRQLGLGITGLADALAMMGIVYGTKEAADLTSTIMREITLTAYETSVALAAEKGSFPTFQADELLAPGTFASGLPEELKNQIRNFGLRNSLLTSIAPTGTISLVAGNLSSGIEPIFATHYERKVLMPDGTRKAEVVQDYAVWLYREMSGDADGPLPPAFVTAQTITPEAHVRMQAAAQAWVDSSISKTVNVPEDFPFEDFKAVYWLAYESGCKGCTTYRPNAVTGSVLSVVEDKPKAEAPKPAKADPVPSREIQTAIQPRPEALTGTTYKIKWPQSPHAIYITINDIGDAGSVRPFEIFINSKNLDHYAWTLALTRMISAVFRRGGDVSFVVEELKAVFDPKGGAWMDGKYVPSLLAAIGNVIERHLSSNKAPVPVPEKQLDLFQWAKVAPSPDPCPACGSFNRKLENGCWVCLDCGYSTCG
jgi:ribonucleoside-diphosphate reductase alpha chain